MKSLQGTALSLVLVAGAVGLIGTSFADFNAQTTNASTFASGTLVLSDAKTGGTTCLSTGSGTTTDTNSNATGCDDLIAATVQKPGGAAIARVVTIRDLGSVAATSLHVFASSACVASNTAAETYHGTGDICTAIALTIHDDTNNVCYYPAAAGACVMAAASTLATFGTAYPSDTTPLVLGTTALTSGIAFTISTQLNSTAGNTMQGRTASISFGWKIAQ